jgi:hypothetical protein
MQDLQSMYGKDFNELITDSFARLINQWEKQKIISFMRANAVVRPNIVLTDSYGTQGNIADVYNDLVSRINQSMMNIKSQNDIDGEFVVIASTFIASGLKTAKDVVTNNKHNRMGNGAILIEDTFALSDYILVSLIGETNGAVIYVPYSYNLYTATSNETFETKILAQTRRDIKNNPLGILQSGKNPMMELTYIDGFSDLINNY